MLRCGTAAFCSANRQTEAVLQSAGNRSLIRRGKLPSNTRSLMAEIASCFGRTPENDTDNARPKHSIAVTNARFAPLHGLPVGPVPPLDGVRSTTQTARSSRVALAELPQKRRLPSAARRRALRSGCDVLCASLRSPLHFPHATADRSRFAHFPRARRRSSTWRTRIARARLISRANCDSAGSAVRYSRTSILLFSPSRA